MLAEAAVERAEIESGAPGRSNQSSRWVGCFHPLGAGARRGSTRPGASPACKQRGHGPGGEGGRGGRRASGRAGGQQHPEPRSPGSSRRADRRSGRTGETAG